MRILGLLIIISAALFRPHMIFAEGSVVALRDYKYWDDGKTRGCDIYDPKGRLTAKSYSRVDGTVEKIEKFDTPGNRIEAIFYDQKGRLTLGIDGWAAKRWFYDGSSLVSEMTYDEFGKPRSKKTYSEGGRLVSAQFAQDADINPYEEANVRLILMGNRKR